MINEELKPCPFCEGAAGLHNNTAKSAYWVECSEPNCGFYSRNTVSPRVSIEVWNTRPTEVALRAELAELREANRWIPVEERLPEAGVKAIATDGDHVDMALYDYNNEWDWWVPIGNADEEITHWRPLPAPPEVTK